MVASTHEVIVMVKSARRKTEHAVTTAGARSSKSLQNRSRQVTDRDIARRAYELFEKRGREHGHDLDDWLQAERELDRTPSQRKSGPHQMFRAYFDRSELAKP